MEMNLPPFIGVLFDWVVFSFVIGPSLAIVVAIWMNHWIVEREFLGPRDVLRVWSRASLDSILVMGILGTTLGIQGMTMHHDVTSTDAELAYSSFRVAMLTFVWGGVLAGLAFAIRDKTYKIRTRISLTGLFCILVIFLFLVGDQARLTGVPIKGGFLKWAKHEHLLPYFL